MSGLLAVELLAVATVAGLLAWSSPVGIVTFVGLSMGIAVPIVSSVIVGALSPAWCVLLVRTDHALWGVPGVPSLGLFGSVVVVHLHLAGVEGLRDASS